MLLFLEASGHVLCFYFRRCRESFLFLFFIVQILESFHEGLSHNTVKYASDSDGELMDRWRDVDLD